MSVTIGTGTTFLVARKLGDPKMHTFFDPTPVEVEAILDLNSGWEVGEVIQWEGALTVAEWLAVKKYLKQKWATA